MRYQMTISEILILWLLKLGHLYLRIRKFLNPVYSTCEECHLHEFEVYPICSKRLDNFLEMWTSHRNFIIALCLFVLKLKAGQN